MVANNYFLVFDFDGTMARTFERSPNGTGVNEAYRLAIKDIFGQTGLGIYDALGGLKNRATSELVSQMLIKNQGDLIRPAKVFFNEKIDGLDLFVPKNKGVPLVWNDDVPEQIIGELLVRQKLRYLMDEVGTQFPDGSIWPRPCEGFIQFWKEIQKLNNETDRRINMAIVSSGHEKFIKKVFAIWGISSASIVITEDDIRGRKYPTEMERRVKPGQLQLALAHQQWLKQQGLVGLDFNLKTAEETKERMIYFGDDPKKDGELAGRSGIVFGWFNPEKKSWPTEELTPRFDFINWQQITTLLHEGTLHLKEGRPLRDIIITGETTKERVNPGRPENGY